MTGELLIFENAQKQIEVRMDSERDTVWLNQAQLSELFERERSVITKHVNNIFKEGELVREAVCAKFAHTADDGKTYSVQCFNLDVIISVGYRVKSSQGVRFRQWATQRLKDYLVQGYALNQQRFDQNASELKQAIALIQKAAHSSDLTAEASLKV